MSSAEAHNPSASSRRNPRRRVRTTSNDAPATRQAPKKLRRSSILPETYDPPQGSSRQVSGQGLAAAASLDAQTNGQPQTSLALRGRGSRRGGERRSGHGERRTTLTKNDHYTLSADSYIPEEVRTIIDHADQQGPWRVSTTSRLGYVATTPTRAIVWRTGGNQPTNAPTAYTLTLPTLPPTLDPSDRRNLPLGSLVHDAGAGDTALLVVLPATKRVLYWESVSAAARADSRRQRAQALEGPIPHLSAYETVESISEAEPDAFVLSTSHGQLLHVSVRDPQGRPALTVHVLGGDPGWWGSIRGALRVGGSGEQVVAVRPSRILGKSRRRCVSATARGAFRVWELVRNGSRTLESEVDARPSILNTVLGAGNEELTKEKEEAELVIRDFVLFPDKEDWDERSTRGEEEQNFHVLLVVTVRTKAIVRSHLLDATLHPSKLHVSVVQPIESVKPADGRDISMESFCKLCLPRPAHTAIVLFASRIVLLSLSPAIDSADMQLQMESCGPPPPFEDTLYFLPDRGYSMVGCSADDIEDGSETAHCVLFISAYGMVRLEITLAPKYESMTDETRRSALCQTKLEQAVFFGAVKPPLLDFSRGIETAEWSKGELETTALHVDATILDSSSVHISTHISTDKPWMEQQLADRATALAALIHAVRGRTDLSIPARWRLLGSAEKMAFARTVWQTHEGHLGSATSDPRVPTARLPFLPELIDMISEGDRHEIKPEHGEIDVVRHFLVYDVARCDLILPWCGQAARELFELDGVTQPVAQAAVLAQANEIYIRGLEVVVKFRASHLDAYGLGDDPAGLLDGDGVYQESYRGLPEPWTASAVTVKHGDYLFDLTADAAERDDSAEPLASPTTEAEHAGVIRIARDASKLARWTLRTFEERARWLAEHDPENSPGDVKHGRELREATARVRLEMLLRLGASLVQPEQGIKLAERYRDMHALAELIACGQHLAEEEAGSAPAELVSLQLESYQGMINGYFGNYGYPWACAYYTGLLRRGEAAKLLERGQSPFLAEFLASSPRYARLRWIHAVQRGPDYGVAREALVTCLEDEEDWWSSRTIVSLAKLAALAEKEQRNGALPAADEETWAGDLRGYEARLAAAETQSRVRAAIAPLTRRAIDGTAAVELALAALGSAALQPKRRAYAARFKAALERLLGDAWLAEIDLLDLLTLLVPTGDDAHAHAAELDWPFLNARFAEALQLLRDGPWEGADRELARRLVWVRCLLRDNWVGLNNLEAQDEQTVAAAMQDTILFHTLTLGQQKGLIDCDNPALSPAALLAGGPPTADDLARSEAFGGADLPDSARRELARDLAADWTALQRVVDEGRLDRWWDLVAKAAADALLEGADEGDEAGANVRSGAVDGEQDGVDEQGDVLMG